MVVVAKPMYYSSRSMPIIISLTERKISKNNMSSKTVMLETGSDGCYIGTVVNSTTSNLIKNYFENQGN
jgi:hypothetical protein